MSLSDKDDFSYSKLSRRDLRSLIFHLIYAAEAFDYTVSVESIIDNFNKGMDLDIPLDSEVLDIAQKVIEERDDLDRIIEPLLDNWRLERIGVCTKLVLRLSIWEIKSTDTPSSIVINEAIELAKCFSEKDAYRFVNGILDEACKKYRADEPVYVVEEISEQELQEENDKQDEEELEFED
jgi:N utilization substance protein B